MRIGQLFIASHILHAQQVLQASESQGHALIAIIFDLSEQALGMISGYLLKAISI